MEKLIEDLNKEIKAIDSIFNSQRKAAKRDFLQAVVNNWNYMNNVLSVPKSLKSCLKEELKAKELISTDIKNITKGTTSRVNKLMQRILGDSKTVRTLFTVAPKQKIDIDLLSGDVKHRAILFNLSLDLEKELNSFWPCANKSRKQFKFNFIHQLINTYDLRRVDENPSTLMECYADLKMKCTEEELIMLNAGKHSRVSQALKDLSDYDFSVKYRF